MVAKRLLVSLDEEMFNEVKELAKSNKTSSSKIAVELIKESLELQEDKLFAKLADKRIRSTKKWIDHIDAWK